MNEINEFWELDQSMMSRESIIEKCVEYYTEDFINNYEKWKENLVVINDIIKSNIIGKISSANYVDITFDFFCKEILDLMKEHIQKYGILMNEDIMSLSNDLINKHCDLVMYSVKDKGMSISDIIDSIKTFVIN